MSDQARQCAVAAIEISDLANRLEVIRFPSIAHANGFRGRAIMHAITKLDEAAMWLEQAAKPEGRAQ